MISEEEAAKSELWKYAYNGVSNLKEYKWMYIDNIPAWLDVIDKAEDVQNILGRPLEYYAQIILNNLSLASKCDENKLIHRDYGTRNIMIYDECVS